MVQLTQVTLTWQFLDNHMNKVIIHTNENGGVSVAYPTPEFLETNTVEDLLVNFPDHSIIIDASTLPQGDDDAFFDAWELNGTTVTVNMTKAKAQRLRDFNKAAVEVAQKRQLNTLAAIENIPDDATFTASLTTGRTAISAANTTTQLLAVVLPS